MPEASREAASLALEAGGLVPPSTPVPSELPVDTVDARGYRHPGLPDRVVVRLVPDAISAGIDTEMSLLGFGLSDHADDIALQRRRTLGFPGHALVTDPDHARYALDVMKEFKTHAKRIGSKPGHAKEGFDGIAERLARQVPHFLPSYWEEVGRSFSTAGNTSYAAQSFDKARAAEREFGLEVDEERRGEAFLEFALLGALSVKSLQSYGKELQKSIGPAKGYERMFGLAVRRTLGGLAPWASLPKDLRALAKGAKLDLAAEDERLLREVLGANAIQRAPATFWDEYRDALLRLAKADPRIRSRLLDVLPTGGKPRYSWRGDDSGFDEQWVEFLATSGALDVLWDAAAPAEALPAGGRAAWLGRYQEWAKAQDGWVLQIVRRAAATLKADGAKIPVRCGDWYKPLDLDLLDLLLELGLTWEPIQTWGIRVDLAKWADRQPVPARAGFPAEARPRDPVHAALDPKVQEILAPAIDAVFGNPTFEAVATGKAGLRDLRRSWLEQQVADLDASGLAATALAVERLEAATTATTFAEFPECLARMKAASVARALQRTLVTGLFDELGWPAFDALVAELEPKPDVDLKMFRQWPHLIASNGRKALVIGPGGREHSHDLKLGKDQLPDGLVWVGGQLWVGWGTWSNGWQRQAYWSSAPQDRFDVEGHSAPVQSLPVEHADALIFGTTRFAVGDRTGAPAMVSMWHDRSGAWTLVDNVLKAIDPATGKVVDGAPPSFLADVLDRVTGAWYYRVPDAIAATSALGVVDGQWGSKTLAVAPADDEDGADASGPQAFGLVTLSGDDYPGTMRHGTARWFASAMMRWPGSDRPRAVVEQVSWWRNGHNPSFYVADPDAPIVAISHDDKTRMGKAWLPPLLYWHYLVPRDPAGSKALRACDLETAEALLASPTAPVPAGRSDRGAVTDPVLRAGIVHVAELAAGYAARLAKLCEARVGGTVAAPRLVVEVQDQAAIGPFGNLRHYWAWGDGSTVTGAIRTLGHFLTHGETGEAVLFSKLEPHEWIGRIRGVAVSATRPGTSEGDREVMGKVLRAWLESGLADDGHVRVGTLSLDKTDPSWMPIRDPDGKRLPHAGWRHDGTTRRLFAWGVNEHQEEGPWPVSFVEWCKDGTFGEWPGAHVTAERREHLDGDRAWLEAFLAAYPANGARAADADEMAAFAEATGLSTAEAACVLATFPGELDKESRAAFGLKATEVKAATAQLRGWSVDKKLELLREAAPADPAALWTPGIDAPLTSALARAWVARKGRSVAVPADLLALADKELSRDGGRLVKQVANHGDWQALDADGTFEVQADGTVHTPSGFTGSEAESAAKVVTWLCGKLPVGHPLLQGAVAVFDKARKRAAYPGLTLASGRWGMYEPKARKAAEAFFDALGGEVVATAKHQMTGDDSCWQRRSGPFVSTKNLWHIELAFRPAELDEGTRELLERFFAASGNARGELGAVDFLQTDDLAALLRRVSDSPLAEGAWEQDPTKSAPEVVAAVAKTHGLSSEAATLYLQTLALLEPTRKNVIEWNRWSPKTYNDAVAELVGKGLALEAKRPRAGREHFLPGAWVEASSILPYEAWKRPLYGDAGEGYPLGTPLPTAPFHVLFARAWERCARGDAPRFEEVRR